MEKELQFQFYQGECASSMRYENNSKVYTFAMDNVMPFGREPNMVDLFRGSSQIDDVFHSSMEDKSLWFNKSDETRVVLPHCPKLRKKWMN